MKKISIFIISILLIVPISVLAAEINVKTLEATATGTTINYNGIMEDGAYAVMCKLYDKDSNEIDLLSSAVDNNKFSGSFEVSSSGDYTVSCANYEGGEYISKEVSVVEETIEEVKETTTNTSTTKSPKTVDNIILYVSLSVISLIGIIFVAIKLKKQMN